MASAPRPLDLQHGVAITSSFHPEAHTHVELCHSNEKQDAASAINVPLVDGGRFRLLRFAVRQLRNPRPFLRSRRTAQASTRTASLLVMQSLDNSLTSYLRRGRLRLRQGTGVPNPSWIPLANDIARRYADKIGGDAMMLASDLAGRPATAHFIGGATIGDSPETGVVDAYHRLWGHPNLHVVDGSTIGANLGVNPSLTIVAMAERAIALWPNQGQADPRPEVGSGYEPVAPVTPLHPAVPDHAPAALRLDGPAVESRRR